MRMRFAAGGVAVGMAACAAVLGGCSTASRSYMAEIRGGRWSEPVSIVMPNADTTGLYDLRIAMRHDGSPVGTTVTMTVRTVGPDSLWFEEPLTMTVGDDGRSRSSQHEASCIYRQRVRLAHEGDYRIIITPAQAVGGVSAVGADMTPSDKE